MRFFANHFAGVSKMVGDCEGLGYRFAGVSKMIEDCVGCGVTILLTSAKWLEIEIGWGYHFAGPGKMIKLLNLLKGM